MHVQSAYGSNRKILKVEHSIMLILGKAIKKYTNKHYTPSHTVTTQAAIEVKHLVSHNTHINPYPCIFMPN